MKMTEGNNDAAMTITANDVKNLIKKKDDIEEQIKAYYDVLEDQGVGVEGPLVDAEGFPRSDVNLYQIRTARHNISCLQNDHKAIMVDIEEALHKLHAREKSKREQDASRQGQAEAMEQGQAEAMEQDGPLHAPFARVEGISQGSPACRAGMRVGDEVVEFGSVNTGNFRNLQNIASVVQHSEGGNQLTCSTLLQKPLRVSVIRDGKPTQMSLTPQQWSGRGLLG
ncbi:26S proteasome non-ATPase regulatory subunit 9 [Merluccius polli]|uniref:26S proteasome non-ATPase regulatory subunit 9 n=1 Tax=Merluccius polli TaxID=89951 RepID=A0AA47MDL6_MERPO|nr:26S proteasome non-ATPase regulatory subunit 9 [Merluccius polli]